MTIKRKLGFWETACKFGHDFFAGTSNIIARANFSGIIDLTLVSSSLQHLYQRHPLLRTVIKEDREEFYFELQNNFSAVPITVIEKTQINMWQDVVENELHKKFISKECLWRIILLYSNEMQQHELIVVFHHAIADGLSTVTFMDEFFASYANVCHNTGQNSSTLPFLSSIEDMLQGKNNWQKFLYHKNDIKENVYAAWQFHRYAPIIQRRMRNIYQVIIPERLFALRNLCRKNNSTINALLNATMLLAAQRQENREIHTSLHTPVNLRNYCVPTLSSEHIGCYISMVKTLHLHMDEKTELWNLANLYQRQLLENIPLIGFCPSDFNISNFDIGQITDLFDMPGSTKRPYFSQGFGVTNIGVINLRQYYGDLKINEFMFNTNHVMGDYVVFLHVLTFNGTLNLCFSYADPLISKTWAMAFVDCFMQILENIAIEKDMDALSLSKI